MKTMKSTWFVSDSSNCLLCPTPSTICPKEEAVSSSYSRGTQKLILKKTITLVLSSKANLTVKASYTAYSQTCLLEKLVVTRKVNCLISCRNQSKVEDSCSPTPIKLMRQYRSTNSSKYGSSLQALNLQNWNHNCTLNQPRSNPNSP